MNNGYLNAMKTRKNHDQQSPNEWAKTRLAILDKRLGKGKGAKRERAKLVELAK